MDQEKLIENVKAYEPLYVLSHAKYSDTGFKENIWKGIAKEMNQPVAVCKKTWTNRRDCFRRAVKKKRDTKSGQAASKIKKWRFEDAMSFLLPVMQERDTYSNLKDISDDDIEDPLNEDEYDDKTVDTGDDRNDNEDNDKDDGVDEELYIEDDKKKEKEEEVNRKIINVAKSKRKRFQTQPETASAVMIKYLLHKKTAKEQITPPSQQPNAIDTFFTSIASTVKNFSPYYQNIAKSQIFSIISDLEMKQIIQEQPFFPPNTPTQRQHSTQLQSYTAPYNVSRPLTSPSSSLSSSIQTVSPSLSRNTIPIPSPSCYDFPTTIPMPHLNETIYAENINM